MSLLDKFKNSVSNVINDEVDKVTSEIEGKLENSVNDLFGKALKGIGIGGKLGRALQSEFANAIQNAKADKFFGTTTSVSDRAKTADICNDMAPKFAETSFKASERLKGKQNLKNQDFYQFPTQTMAYYTRLEFREYVRPSPQTKPTTEIRNTIVLPLPKDLEESINVRLSQDDAGMAGGGFDALERMTKGGEAGNEAFGLILQAATKKINEATSGQLGQITGGIPNPYVTLMFSGVDLRTFTFSWKFAPRNKEESAMIQAIIKIIKGASLPSYSQDSFGILQYPLMCKMTLMSNGPAWDEGAQQYKEGSHPIIGFKNALIENVTVNYAPNGIPSFFADSRLPTFYQLSITLKEIEYFTAGDYGREPGTDTVTSVANDVWNNINAAATRENPNIIAKGIVETANEGKDLLNDVFNLGQ